MGEDYLQDRSNQPQGFMKFTAVIYIYIDLDEENDREYMI